jgi:predicted component of type VI protein secretion system
MPRLLIKNVQAGASEIRLRPGLNRLGRSEENDCQFSEPSMSRFHCEITVADDGIWIRDLGSSNGTFVDGERIQEASIRPGQALQLGAMEMILEDDITSLGTGPPGLPTPPALPKAASVPAVPRPLTVAAQRPAGLAQRPAGLATAQASFSSLVAGAFSYPFKRDGLILLICGTIFFTVLKWAFYLSSFAPLFGGAALLILF